MKTMNFIKTICLVAVLLLTASASAQTFTIDELISLAKSDTETLKSTIQNKGYALDASKDRGANVTELKFKSDGYTFIYNELGFGTNTTMLTWRFNTVADYNNALKELKDAGYTRTNNERRKGGKYISQYFDRGELRFIVTQDFAGEYDENYAVSLMYTPR